MILLTQSTLSSKTHGDRGEWWLPGAEGEGENGSFMDTVSIWEGENVLQTLKERKATDPCIS